MFKRITAFIIAVIMSFTICYAKEVGIVRSYYLLKYEYGSFVAPLMNVGVTEDELLVFFDDVEKGMQGIEDLTKENFEVNLKEVLLNVATYRENRNVSSAIVSCYGDEISEYTDTGIIPEALQDVYAAVVRAIFNENETDKLELVKTYEKYNKLISAGLDGYTQDSVQNLRTGMDNALSVLKNKSATQSEIDNVLSDINSRYNALQRVSQPGGNGGNGGNGSGGNTTIIPTVTPPPSATNPPSGNEDNKSDFSDVPRDYWGYEAISKLCGRGIINGYNDNTFKLEKLITREEFAKILCTALKLEKYDDNISYTDVGKDAWFERYVNAVTVSKLMQGKDNNCFGVGDTLTRQDMAVIAYRAITENLVSREEKNEENTEAFNDIDTASEYAKESITMMQKYGIINGIGNNEFAPFGGVTRAQAAKIVYDLIK